MLRAPKAHFERPHRISIGVLVGLIFVGVAVVSTGACKQRKDSESAVKVASTNMTNPAVDMNDLSYMFVKNKAGQIYPFIPVSKPWLEILAQAEMKMNDGGNNLPIMTSPVYQNVVAATENQGNFTPQNKGLSFKGIKTPFNDEAGEARYRDFEYDQLVVTSFRIDPCAPSLVLDPNRSVYNGPSKYWQGNNGKAFVQQAVGSLNAEINRLQLGFQLSGCQTQIRLIIQAADAAFKVIGESTIHMVFTLNGQNAPQYAQPNGVMHPNLAKAVLDLKLALQKATKIDTTGLMLQEHPGLKYEALGNNDHTKPGAGAKEILRFLHAYVGGYQNSQVMAIIRETKGKVPVEGGGTTDGIIDVILGGGTSSGNYQPNPLVSSSPASGFIMTSSAQRGSWKIVPAPEINQPINMGIFNNAGLNNVANPENEVLARLMNADNPETTHFFANDCITCHGSSQLLREMLDKSTAQGNSKRYQIPAGVTGFPIGSYLPDSAAQAGGVMLRNFGYSRDKPIIGLRTVTETAALVDYFNRDLRRVPNPGADCLTPQGGQLEAQLWTRTMNIGLKPEFGSADSYGLDLEKLRMSRMAPEDTLFANCRNGSNQVEMGKSDVGPGSCPAGYVGVPGDSAFNTSTFCVMKYEAKSGVASVPNGKPLVSIDWNEAKEQCQSKGQGYHLITNPEWMTVAANIAQTAANWEGGSVGSGTLNRGRSDSSNHEALAATSDDNAAWDIQRRTHKLSSGEVIWDLSGNVWEWVDYFNPRDKIGAKADRQEVSTFSSGTSKMAITELRPTSSSHAFWQNGWNSKQGTGQYYAGTNGSGGALVRGGDWRSGSFAGVFAAGLYSEPLYFNEYVGFRCAFSNAH